MKSLEMSRRLRLAKGITLLLLGATTGVSAADLVVDADFPNGSATVESIDQTTRTVRLVPTKHLDRGWDCWWSFKLTGIEPGETITLDVGRAPWATPDRATFSLNGQTWLQTAPGEHNGQRIVYQQKIDQTDAFFAWGPPFTTADAERLVESIAGRSPHAEAFTLCTTREGRPTRALRIREGDSTARRKGVWIQARQHAWESGSSWVGKGFIEWLVSDEKAATRLRQQATIVFVPIMDVDNVHRGAGGKNQVPQDHNRDWTDTPYWRSVAAAQQLIRQMDQNGEFDVFVDLHNPGPNNRQPYFYIPGDEVLSEARRTKLQEFLRISKEQIRGPLSFEGSVIPSGKKYDPQQWQAISKNWVATHCREHVVSVTLETAWNTPNSTTDGYRQVGRELGQSISRFLLESRSADE